MLTLGELLDGLNLRLLAGGDGVEVPVRWVHISELEDPTPWLSGGEVLLTTGMQLQSPDGRQAFVERLVGRRVAGIGFGVGFAHRNVPSDLVAAADAAQLPIFEVPYEVPFIAVTELAFTRLVNEQYGMLRRALAAHGRLERIVLTESGPEALVGALAEIVAGTVLLLDGRGRLLAQKEVGRMVEPATVESLRAAVLARRRRHDPHLFMPDVGDPSRCLALPVAADGGALQGDGPPSPEAWVVVLKDSEPLSDFDHLVLRQAVTIVALELLRGRVAGDTERRLAGDVFTALLQGELVDAEISRRLEPFGIADRVGAFVLEKPGVGRSAAAAAERALASALRSEAGAGLVASSGSLVCGLVPGDGTDEELFALADRVARLVARDLDVPVTLGAGRAVAAAETRRAYHEARCALEARSLGVAAGGAAAKSGAGGPRGALGDGDGLRAITGEDTRVATYRDLGSFQLLLSLQDDEALKLYCDSILSPIEESEGDYGGELMRSLEAFIEENGQWERAARRLPCHRHTLRYRIRRVEQLTGRDLASARDRIEFWLALRGRELV